MPKLKIQSKAQRAKKKNEYIIKIRNKIAKDLTSIIPVDESQEISENKKNNALSTHADISPYESKNKKDHNAHTRIQTSSAKLIVAI